MRFLSILILIVSLVLNVSIAQTTDQENTEVKSETTESYDRGSAGAITMEEYNLILEEYKTQNPGKSFESMTKEEFETYLTTNLYELRKKRAEEEIQNYKEETQELEELEKTED